MKSRNLLVGLVVAAGSMFMLAGPASAEETSGTCVVHSLPSFIAQGEGTVSAMVGDVIEVECNPAIYGTKSKVKLTASQLFSRCEGRLKWYLPNQPGGEEEPGGVTTLEGFRKATGRGVSLTLDADGNGTAVLLAGPFCAAGESLITVHQEQEPFESFTTPFTVLPPVTTPPGVFALPSSQVEDSFSSAVGTIVQVEFNNGSEQFVRIGSEELFRRCRLAPHLRWILMNGQEIPAGEGGPEGVGASEVNRIQLDNDGNAFVIVIGDHSCAPGTSLIEADLESKPFTTYTTNFTIEAPRPTF